MLNISQDEIRRAPYANGFINITINYNEFFKPFPLNPRFFVSNLGSVYDSLIKLKLIARIDYNGYMVYYLENFGNVFAHRLVAFTFLDNINYDYGNIVNHINNCKVDNNYKNLEWSNNKDNIIHGQKFKTNKIENSFDEATKMKICELISQNKSSKEISKILGIPFNSNFVKLISKVRNRYLWKEISSNFDFSNKIYDETLINNICFLLDNGIDSKDIAYLLGIECDSKFFTLISDIRHKRRWVNISNNYLNIKPIELSKYEVELICKYMNDGVSSKEISNILKREYNDKFLTMLSFIRTGRTFREISSKYPNIVKHYTV